MKNAVASIDADGSVVFKFADNVHVSNVLLQGTEVVTVTVSLFNESGEKTTESFADSGVDEMRITGMADNIGTREVIFAHPGGLIASGVTDVELTACSAGMSQDTIILVICLNSIV